jgi:hypothetical protein
MLYMVSMQDEEVPVEGMEDLNHPYPAPPSTLRINDVTISLINY